MSNLAQIPGASSQGPQQGTLLSLTESHHFPGQLICNQHHMRQCKLPKLQQKLRSPYHPHLPISRPIAFFNAHVRTYEVNTIVSITTKALSKDYLYPNLVIGIRPTCILILLFSDSSVLPLWYFSDRWLIPLWRLLSAMSRPKCCLTSSHLPFSPDRT